ncbi:hypothetical protein [Caldivirga maquilingensis]|uniref:Vitamin K epoxide reductase n=1 Tax=Caldivirga maquilingensis (strain ATCC 700844 / DSM 13496 / JCM 10307 / IC-167) TaxID=397948 RepID=A8MC35_CALMQ|nr:hypothetical protein [Caldivirga maquilingensis]ABW01341.1 hypothetical protein Cmaq_0496 [Caldivirga maquilingensis IC-167]
MNYLAILPAAGSVLMAYYTYENSRRINACLPGVFNCELFSFLVPRRIRLAMAVGAMVTLALMAFLILINLYLYVIVLSLIGLVIGMYGVYLQVRKGAYCLYCLTTDVILFVMFILSVLRVV